MRKKILYIVCGALALALIVAAFVYFTPRITPVDVTLSAQKWDGWGNEDGTVEITVKGKLKEYLFKPDVLDVDVISSDGVLNYESQLFDKIDGEVRDHDNAYVPFRQSYYSNADQISILIYFSRNLNRWMFEVNDYSQHDSMQPMLYLKAIYIGSADEYDFSIENVCDYFEPLFPFA